MAARVGAGKKDRDIFGRFFPAGPLSLLLANLLQLRFIVIVDRTTVHIARPSAEW